MASTTQKLKSTAKDIQDSANQIWLAGLGAFSNAQEESEKVFESLVKQGQEFESKTSSNVRKKMKVAEGHVQGIRNRANSSVEKLELVFEERVQQVLAKLGVPSQNDLEVLNQKIEELRASLPEKKKRLR
jgi:poly(hydroxyalkanoate) granule-associated protein